MVRIFREYRNTVVKYKQFPSHLRKKKDFSCDRNVLVFSGKKTLCSLHFFSGSEYVNYFNFFHLGFENKDLFQLSPRF